MTTKQMEAEIMRLRSLIDRDRTGLAEGLNRCRALATSYSWIPAGEWGSYEWDQRTEQTFRDEVGRCFDELEKIASDALRESGRRAFLAFNPDKDHQP